MYDFSKDWNELTDTEKLDWTVECNSQKEKEVIKFSKKNGLSMKACEEILGNVNPLDRWYDARAKEARKIRRLKG